MGNSHRAHAEHPSIEADAAAAMRGSRRSDLTRRAFFGGSAAVCIVHALPSHALAAVTTLYVDSVGGDDASSGASASSPVRSLARASALAGDMPAPVVVRLKRGGLWREQMQTVRGMQLGAYGSGDLPVIKGSDVLVGTWTVSDAENGVWWMPLSVDPGLVWVDDDYLPKAASKAALSAASGWFFQGGRIFLRTSNGRSPSSATVERYVRTWGIFSYGTADDVLVEDIAILHAQKGIESYDNHGWKVRRCDVSECFENAIRIVSGGKSIVGVEVVDNRVGAVRWNPVIDYWRSGIAVCGAASPLIEGNTVATVNTCGIWVDEQNVGGHGGAQNMAPVVRSNVVEDCMGGIYVFQAMNADVTRNVVRHGRGLGIGFGGARSSGTYAAGNLIHDIEIAPDRSLYNGFDINNCPDGILEFNTVANVSNFSVTLEDDEVPSDNWVIRNNIFDARDNKPNSSGNGPAGCLSIHDGVTHWLASHNCYVAKRGKESSIFERGDTGAPYLAFVAMTLLTGEIGALETSDPMFVNAAGGDFHLAPGSPCIRRGEFGADMGAYGYGRSPVSIPGIDILFRAVR